MGSQRVTWVSLDKAAKSLGTTPDNVLSFTRSGLLRFTDEGDDILIREDDLEELRELGNPAPVDSAELQRKVIHLEQRVKRLEAALDLLYRANNMASVRLQPLDDQTLISLYGDVTRIGQSEEWPVEVILSCCEVFLQLTEDECERLERLMDDEAPWRPFYNLCLKQLRYLAEHPDLHTKAELQRARDLLDRGRDNLRRVVVTLTELKGLKGLSFDMVGKLAATDLIAFDTIVYQLKKDGGRKLSLK